MSAKQAFISYSHQDSVFVHTLAYLLKSLKFKIWIDYNINPGNIWKNELKQHIDDSFVVIFIQSPDSVKSKWVAEELTYAQKQDKIIIPIIYNPKNEKDAALEPPFGLNQVQAVDLSKQPNYWLEQVISELEKTIGKEDGSQPSIIEIQPSDVLDDLVRDFTQSATNPITLDQLILFLSEKKLISRATARLVNHTNTKMALKNTPK